MERGRRPFGVGAGSGGRDRYHVGKNQSGRGIAGGYVDFVRGHRFRAFWMDSGRASVAFREGIRIDSVCIFYRIASGTGVLFRLSKKEAQH